MSKGGNKTQTTTENSSTVYPEWTQTANQGLNTIGLGMNSPFLKAPAYGLAGFTPDQTKAFDLARQQAMAAFTGSATALPTNASMTAAQVAAPGASQFATAGMPAASRSATVAAPQNVSAAQLGASDFQQFLNPYINAVVDTTTNKARKELRQTEADIGARYAAAGAFGGGREVLARGKAQEAFDENIQATTAQLMAQGYDTATANALANTQLRQQAEQANAERSQAAEMANAGYRQQALQSDADRAQQTALQNAGYQQQAYQSNADRALQAAMQNAGYEQDARSTNLSYGLNAAQIADAFRDSQLARQNSSLATLLGVGGQQQQQAQAALDLPYAALQRYAGLVPQVYNTQQTGTSTVPDNSPGPLQTLLGGATTILGMGTGGGGTIAGSLLGGLLK